MPVKTIDDIADSAEAEIARGLSVVLKPEDWDLIDDAIEAALREAVAQRDEEIRAWHPASAKPCPLCRYENGKYLGPCAYHREKDSAVAQERAALLQALDGVLDEAGLQAHKIGCPSRFKRPRASQGTEGPCRGCVGENLLSEKA